jgi:hypothetical protein
MRQSKLEDQVDQVHLKAWDGKRSYNKSVNDYLPAAAAAGASSFSCPKNMCTKSLRPAGHSFRFALNLYHLNSRSQNN